MRRLGGIISISVLIVLLSFSLSFAAGLELIDSYPKEGSNDSMLENVMVKLYFNEDVSARNVQNINEDCFTFKDFKGKKIPLRVLYSEKKPKEIWVLVDKTLTSDSDYKLLISGDLTASNGDTLGTDTTVEFKTRNVDTDTKVNMGLMAVMVVGMMVFSSISMKRQLKKESEEKSDNKVNPYKVAKETGKSVTDVVAKVEKQKIKAQTKNAKSVKQSKANVNLVQKVESVPENGIKRVSKPKPISYAGSTYKTGRKAAAEKAAAKEAAKRAATTTNPKNSTGKSKNKHKKK